MSTDRQQALLAVLKARGPAHPADLACHPIIRDHYQPFDDRFTIRDELAELAKAGEVVKYKDTTSDSTETIAYDIPGTDRPNWDVRYQRAVDVQREHERRAARRQRRA